MTEKIDEIAERLMELPRVIVAEQQRTNKVIAAMIRHQISLTQLICNLHGIEHEGLQEAMSNLLKLIEEAEE